MIRNIANTVKMFSSGTKIPRPRDPTVAESFETKVSPRQAQILMDPRGFMSEQQKTRENQNAPQKAGEVKAEAKQAKDFTGKVMQPEYGFKPKGPQPTRFGDWQIKGKCVDF